MLCANTRSVTQLMGGGALKNYAGNYEQQHPHGKQGSGKGLRGTRQLPKIREIE